MVSAKGNKCKCVSIAFTNNLGERCSLENCGLKYNYLYLQCDAITILMFLRMNVSKCKTVVGANF